MARDRVNVEPAGGHTGMTRRQVLEMYTDESFIPPDSWTPHVVAVAEGRRIQRVALAAAVAHETPRRVGANAPSSLMATDKWLCKKIVSIEYNAWKRLVTLSNAPLPPEELAPDEQDLYPPSSLSRLGAAGSENEEAWRLGRTVDWFEWWETEQQRLLARRISIATFAMYRDQQAWGWRMVENATIEIRMLQRRFSEYDERLQQWDKHWRARVP
jgi:hypothetical protein